VPFKGVFEDNGKIVSYLDELRYYLMSRPQPQGEIVKTKSEQAAFKERLIRGRNKGRRP
jgi:hypothetical protein